MPVFVQQLITRIDRLTDLVGRTASWFTLIMVLTMGLIVLLRYAFSYGSIALQESVIYINAIIFTFGTAYALKERAHVRVDIFYNRLSPVGRAWIDLLGTLLLLLPAMILIFAYSWDYVAASWRVREGSAEGSGLPFVYLLKTALLLFTSLMLLQGLAEGLKALRQILGARD